MALMICLALTLRVGNSDLVVGAFMSRGVQLLYQAVMLPVSTDSIAKVKKALCCTVDIMNFLSNLRY